MRLCGGGDVRFGFRSVSAHDRAIWVNGIKWFMRGNLDNCHFPLTGAPDTSVEWWRETFRRLRDEDGVNAIRFHSWTPPRAAFAKGGRVLYTGPSAKSAKSRFKPVYWSAAHFRQADADLSSLV